MKKLVLAVITAMIIMSLCILPAMAEENIAIDKEVYCETETDGATASLEGGFWGAQLLTDGEIIPWDGSQDMQIGWYALTPKATGRDCLLTITVDLEAQYEISSVKLYAMYFLNGAQFPSDYKVLVSENETDWVEIGSESGLSGTHDINTPFVYEKAAKGRYVQISITRFAEAVQDNDWYYAGIKEIEIYGTKVFVPTPEPTEAPTQAPTQEPTQEPAAETAAPTEAPQNAGKEAKEGGSSVNTVIVIIAAVVIVAALAVIIVSVKKKKK